MTKQTNDPKQSRFLDSAAGLRLIPLDVWAAIALAVAIVLVAIFDPIPAILLGACLALCVYMIAEIFDSKLS